MFRKWKKGGGGATDAHREKFKDDLYSFKKTIKHGFPYLPSALAHDPKLKLMAIGNKSGDIKIFGKPGVEFTGTHEQGNNQVCLLHFICGQGKLVSVLDDNSIHLWSLEKMKTGGGDELKWIKSNQLPGRPGVNQITVVEICSDNSSMWVGTESGTIHKVALPNLHIMEKGGIHQDQIIQSVPDNCKTGKALGSVEAISEHPATASLILIGYNRGLIALWNDETQNVDHFYPNVEGKTLESLAWNSNCKEFMSAYSDGYLCNWRVDSSSPHNTYSPYGPFPCKPILKALWKSSRSHTFVIFSGGMPRANYGDRHCISVIQDNKHVTFDFTSRIIDYFAICKSSRDGEEVGEFLVVLAEEELVVIDLQEEGWPSLPLPYLASPHASAITCCQHIYGVSDTIFQKIQTSNQQTKSSTAEWPINGGEDLSTTKSSQIRSLLLTGHEDGNIKIWEVSGVAMWPVMKIQTSNVFQIDGDGGDDDEYGEEFPPFRRIGEFDPYSDDPRLAVRKVSMCPVTGTIVAGGTAGQVLVLSLSQDAIDIQVPYISVDMLQARTDFTWKGHEKLDLKTSHIAMKPGYQVTSVLQCEPPASITALSLNANWGLVGVGTSHGFALFDFMQNDMIISRCTLEAGEQLAMEGNFSRVRSLKMSIRQSMRRISGSFRGGGRNTSRRASGRRKHRGDMNKKLQEANAALVDEEAPSSGGWSPAATGHRRIEARSVDDGMTGMVRCCYFAQTYLRDAEGLSPTFWAGTNSGSVYCYALHIPDYSKRQDHQVSYVAGKLIQLKHGAPVIDICVVDGDDIPASSPNLYNICQRLNNNQAPITSSPERKSSAPMLVISSEEQVKVFSLPKFSPKRKIKITAVDGSLIRKVKIARFHNSNSSFSEYNLVCLTNTGEIHMFSHFQQLRLHHTITCLTRDNVTAISSALLTSDSQGLYQCSQSEFQRFSLSPASCVDATCRATIMTSQQQHDGSGDHAAATAATTDDVAISMTSHSASEDNKSTPSSVDVNRRRSPSSRSSKKLNPSSPKTPLLCDDDDDDDDDDHVNKHESFIEDLERTIAEAQVDDDDEEVVDPDQVVVDVDQIIGAVAEAERVLNEDDE